MVASGKPPGSSVGTDNRDACTKIMRSHHRTAALLRQEGGAQRAQALPGDAWIDESLA